MMKYTVPDFYCSSLVESDSLRISDKEKELEKSVNGHAVPRFSIFKPFSTEKVDTLKHCFIKRMRMERKNLPAQICADDGLVYTAVYDSRIPAGMESFEVVISFQQHNYGRFAVIRVADEQKRRKF